MKKICTVFRLIFCHTSSSQDELHQKYTKVDVLLIPNGIGGRIWACYSYIVKKREQFCKTQQSQIKSGMEISSVTSFTGKI